MGRLPSCAQYHVLLGIWTLLIASPLCRADGKFFPTKAYKAIPTIPHQRALIVHRDGQETLIIESSFDGIGQDFSWIIPVPAQPSSFNAVSPGLLKTISLALQPKITTPTTGTLSTLILIALLALLWSLRAHFFSSTTSVWSLLMFIIFILLILGIFMPSLSRTRSLAAIKSSSDVTITSAQVVGNYTVAALKPQSAAALDDWLTNNGFISLPRTDFEVVTQYIHEGWQFVAAKLRRPGSQTCTPHPLAISFPSKKPVYPMRLTGTIGKALALDLYVIADKRLDYPDLETELCDRFTRTHKSVGWYQTVMPCFEGQSSKQKIGHPDTQRYLWDGCVVTWLCGELDPEEMHADYILTSRPFSAQHRHYYTTRAALGRSWLGMLLTFILIVVWGTRRSVEAFLSAHAPGKVLARNALILISCAGAVGFLIYLVLPKTHVGIELRSYSFPYYERELHMAVAMAFDEADSRPSDIQRIQSHLNQSLQELDIKNPFEGQLPRLEDSPGNYTFDIQGDRITLRVYDPEGFPRPHELP